jgi:hypothetical protein
MEEKRTLFLGDEEEVRLLLSLMTMMVRTTVKQQIRAAARED